MAFRIKSQICSMPYKASMSPGFSNSEVTIFIPAPKCKPYMFLELRFSLCCVVGFSPVPCLAVEPWGRSSLDVTSSSSSWRLVLSLITVPLTLFVYWSPLTCLSRHHRLCCPNTWPSAWHTGGIHYIQNALVNEKESILVKRGSVTSPTS